MKRMRTPVLALFACYATLCGGFKLGVQDKSLTNAGALQVILVSWAM